MKFTYKTSGVCSRSIDIEVEDNVNGTDKGYLIELDFRGNWDNGQLGLDYDTLNAYNDIKDGISNVLSMDKTADGYEQARDAEINKVLTEQGVELDEATVNEIGDYIDANFADATELSDENLNEILLYYFETWKFTE